jgi:phosphoglycolate phosphatase-like HAD superfamily hydrolase
VQAVAIELDGVLGDTRPLWEGWLEQAARRYSSIAALDPASLPRDRASAARELDRWAEGGIGEWRPTLARYTEEHAPLHLRPDPAVGAALRKLGREGVAVGVFTDAPEPLARIALAQVGALRRIQRLEAGERALERLLAELGPDTRVVRNREQLAELAGQLETERSR